jgi:ornithine--oxo-acid transaminase
MNAKFSNPHIELEERYCAHNYAPLPVVLSRGEDVWLWDDHGHRYLDLMSAYSAVSFGHAHPRLVAALAGQARRLAVTSRAFYSDRLGLFLQRLCEMTGMTRALPMNSGAEAVETSIKAARKWAYTVKRVAEGRARIVVCRGNFAGRTTTIVGFSSEAQYRAGFGPFDGGFDSVPFGDAAALEAAITPDTAAFLVEPIQGEGGIVVPPDGYLRRCREICSRHGVLMICDEVQTGLGRTGQLLACDHDGIRPDGLVLGKALGGGLLPVSAFLATDEVMEVFTPGDHGSTFGGNALSAAVAFEALGLLLDGELIANAREQGRRLMEGLRRIAHPALREVRGRGLLVGIDLDPRFIRARAFCERLMACGALTKETHDTVVRLAPPLTIGSEEIDFALRAIRDVFQSIPRSPA